jgi:hypothetical protein
MRWDGMWWDVMRSCAPDTICRSVVCTRESQQNPICAAKAACASNKRESNEEKTGKALGKEEESCPEWGVKTPNFGGRGPGGPDRHLVKHQKFRGQQSLGVGHGTNFLLLGEKLSNIYSISILLLLLLFFSFPFFWVSFWESWVWYCEWLCQFLFFYLLTHLSLHILVLIPCHLKESDKEY